jgi:hypothetical protein
MVITLWWSIVNLFCVFHFLCAGTPCYST